MEQSIEFNDEELQDIDINEELPTLTEETVPDNEERRVARKRKRRKNQMVAYVSILVFVLILTVGVFSVVHLMSERENRQEVMNQIQQQEKVDALLADEEELELNTDPIEEEVVELTDVQKLDEIVNAAIEVMPLEDKVAGLFIVSPEALTGVSTAIRAGDNTQEALGHYAVGGIIYSGKNMQSVEQLQEMINNTRLFSKYPLFIAVDEEGGSVSRVADAGLAEKSDTASAIGATGDPNNAYQTGKNIGLYLSELGFNLDFAPVADVAAVEGNALGSRVYGATAEEVIPYVTGMMRGLEENVTACLKHFPGIGNTEQDTHVGMAMTERTKEEFYAEEFTVFQAGIENGANMIMVGHISAPYLTVDSIPCSMSSAVVTDILREDLGFEGVIITDAMNMSAISEYYSSEEAAVMALRAGCDMILMPENFKEAYDGVLKAVQDGVISEERVNDSLRRIYRIKYADRIAQ